jgi:hypothetical protein
LYTSSFLRGLRRKALRRRLWFKALDTLERGFYNLTCEVVDRVESLVVYREILDVVVKLRNALKGEFVRLVESVGVAKAWRVAGYAIEWGNNRASRWNKESCFARYHTLVEMHCSSGWRV